MPNAPLPFVARSGDAPTAAWVAALQAALPDETIVAFRQLSEAQKNAATIAVVANPDPADLRQLPRLRWVHSVWAGVERLVAEFGGGDGDGAPLIVRLVDPQLARTMSEAVLAWTLYLHRAMPAYAHQQRQRLWQELPYRRAEQTTVGLLGLGALGAASAGRLAANGFRVCGWSRTAKALPGVDCYCGEAGLDTMLARTDVLVCLLPLTPATNGLVDARRLAQLPRGASLINFARGAIVVDADLRAALNSGWVDHAVLDVFAVEPLPVADWAWHHRRVTVLPHVSAPTDPASAAQIVAANVRRYRQSGELPAAIDVGRGY